MKPLSYDKAWTDLVEMARSNTGALAAMAGVFLLLPNFAQTLLAPPPQIEALDWNGVQMISRYFQDNVLILFGCQVPVWIGTAAIMLFMIEPGRFTVGQSLAAAAGFALSVIVLNWLLNVMMFGGLVLFLLPGIYLLGRLSVAIPVQMSEGLHNPLAAIARSMELTRGNGWRIAGLVLLVAIVASIVVSAMNGGLGVLVRLAAPEAAATSLIALVQATLGAASALLVILLSAAIYQQVRSGAERAA
mgnify:CR=1 FL=1